MADERKTETPVGADHKSGPRLGEPIPRNNDRPDRPEEIAEKQTPDGPLETPPPNKGSGESTNPSEVAEKGANKE